MKRGGIQLSKRHRWWLGSVGASLFLSGGLWLLLGWLLERGVGFTDYLRLFQSGLLKLHGAAAMALLVALGILIPTHIVRGWRARRNRTSGVVFLVAIGLLIVTGYGLYYFGSEYGRLVVRWIHLTVGFALPLFLVGHIWTGRKNPEH